MPPRILFDPAPTDGGGKPEEKGPDYSALLAKHSGDAGALAMALFGDNSKLHGDVAKLKADLSDARKAIPPQGSRVLSADEAKALDAYAALGSPQDVAKALDEGKASAGKVREHDREKLIGDAASLHGFKADVLAKLAGADLAIEINPKGKRDGKDAKVAEVLVKEKDKDGKESEVRTPLDEYAKEHWESFAPALQAKPAPQERATPSFARTAPIAQPNGQPAQVVSVF